MIEDLYPVAVQYGVDAERFWGMSFKEVMIQTLANRKNRIDEMKFRAMMDHQQANLIAFAFNDPNKMPKPEEAYPFLKDDQQKQVEQAPEWKKDQMQLMAQAARVKAFNKLKKGGTEHGT